MNFAFQCFSVSDIVTMNFKPVSFLKSAKEIANTVKTWKTKENIFFKYLTFKSNCIISKEVSQSTSQPL